VPDDQREEAEARYRAAFSEWQVADADDDGRDAVESYAGQSPASDEKAVRKLIGYAIDHKLWVEIDYPSEKPENNLPRIVEPVSEDHAMVYGYCRWRKGDRVFRLNKIQSAVLRPRESDEADRRRVSS
jgi:predicted DNA-binding transcriptional regulator YafY